jgi:hypothetical protein
MILALRIRILAISALASTLLTSCATVELFEQDTVEYFEDLGSVHVTLFDPVPFEQYKAALQPTFSLSPSEALKEVVPVTQFQDQSRFAGSSIGISVVGPTKTNTVSETSSKQTTGDSTTSTSTIEKTKGRTSATPPEITPGDLAQRKTAAQQSAGVAKSLGEQAPVDPFLKYWTAAALYQEVQLLNRFWKNLAQSDQYVPYVVRTQVATLPLLRNAPYDALVDLGFWTKHGNGDVAQTSAPKVIPLVVTDNLEAQSRKLSVEQVRDVAIGLKGMAGLAGIGASISDYDQLLRSVIGREINSLLTVARLDDSVLRVRLGALQQAGSAYAMVPRTHTITTLLLVPKEAVKDHEGKNGPLTLNVESYARFIDARTGKPLESITEEKPGVRYGKRVNRILKRAGIDPLDNDQVKALIAANESQNFENFTRALLPAKKKELDDFFKCVADRRAQLTAKNRSLIEWQVRLDDVAKIRSMVGRDALALGGGDFEPFAVMPPVLREVPECPGPQEVGEWGGYVPFVASVRALMPRISGVTADSPYDRTATHFPPNISKDALCVFHKTRCPKKVLEPLMLLDDSEAVKVSIAGLGKPIPSQVDVLLHVVEQDGKKREIVFPASSIATDTKGSGLQLEFPSLIPWSLHGEKVDRKISLHWIDSSGIRSDPGVDFSNTKYEAEPGKAPISAKMVKAQGSEQIAQKDTKGDLWLTFSGIEKNKDKIYLSIANARIEKTVPEKAIDVDNKYQVTKDGTVQLKLGNLAAATKVVLKLYTDDKRESAPLEVSVK